MTKTKDNKTYDTGENFAQLFEDSKDIGSDFIGQVVTGYVMDVDEDYALVDVGLKSEGRISLKEFGAIEGGVSALKGQNIEVFVDRYENKEGLIVLSREKARREESWIDLEKSFNASQRVEGTIFGRVKGGFTVDLQGAVAFLPGSQVDIRPVRDIGPLMNSLQPFQILKMDRQRGNIVVSRRAVLEETRAEQRNELISNLAEGQVLDGVVKNITDYGAFVDLGGVDGLLHVTDIAWRRIMHPSEVLQLGQTITVQIIKFNMETHRISLGIKQLVEDPWDGVKERFPLGSKFVGRVTNITDYGAFVQLEEGIEGLVHVSEMSWTKKNVHPGKIVSSSQEVEVMVLDIDHGKRRISLGLKQCMDNPWEEFEKTHSVGDHVTGEIKNITEFGLFIGLTGGIDGMVHLSDLSWGVSGDIASKDYEKGQEISACILDVDVEKERISLGVKQLTTDPFAQILGQVAKGERYHCQVISKEDDLVEVSFGNDLSGYIRQSELSLDRALQKVDSVNVGDELEAKVVQIDKGSRRVYLSVKGLEVEEEKEALAHYGTSSDSGALLGDILGEALKKKQEK